MIKKIQLIILIIISICGLTSCKKNNIVNYPLKENKTKESEKMTKENINVIINNENYTLNLENNKTVKEFMKLLPKEYKMNELNGNEKYVYLDTSLPTNSQNIEQINKGDVMLYGNNCLVIFYQSFKTSYSYTKIGHIDNLPNLGNENIIIKFE